MENRLFNIITANIETDNHLLLRKIVINNVFLMVATVILTLAALINTFIFYNYEVAIIDSISAVTTLYAAYMLKKTKNIEIAQVISSINIFAFFLVFIFLTENNNFSFIWTIFVPVFLIPILGHRKGLFLVAIFYIFFFILGYFNLGIWQNGNWDTYSFTRLVLASILLTYLTYINELTIFQANQMLKVKEIQEKQNIEELIKSRDRAIKAEKSKDVFLANMSHEIRTPLNAMLGFVNILKKEVNDVKHQKYLSVIDTSSHSLLSIIGDILDFAKLRSGKLDIVKKPYDIEKELQIVFELFQESAKQKQIFYSIDFKTEFDKLLLFDKMRVNQIVSNFLSNAIKFTPENGAIFVEVKREENFLQISVRDTGIGIAEEEQESVFKAFEQVQRDTTTTHYAGTGLGLAISLQLAHLMQGDIFVKSTVGKGSEFILSLPIEITDRERIKSREIMQKEKNKNQKLQGRVLVAEDNKANQMLIELLLQEMDIKVDIANNGEEALSLYKESSEGENPYSLILMDNNMPVMGGIEATQKIKADSSYYGTPIVALTANALKGDREHFLENGMDDYLKKPLKLEELIEVLDKFVK